MNLAFFDPHQRNEYASRMFIQPLMAYAKDKGVPVKWVSHLVPEHGWAHIANADYLTPEVLRHFKENDCPIYGISCIDSAYPSETLRGPHLADVTKLFMVSGVQNTNTSHATVIDPDFTIRSEPRQFLPEDEWQVFDAMRKAGRILSLPYVPWQPLEEVAPTPFKDKRPTILFRGGNHLLRFVAYLMALRNGSADHRSGFQTRAYFADDMNPQFRYCDGCRRDFNAHNQHYPYGLPRSSSECQSEAPWGDRLDMSVTGPWNNRCPQSFYWLAEQFAAKHGPLDFKAIERALNHHNDSAHAHLTAISQVRFYAECKWEFSIHMPQRAFEGASVGTIIFLPKRASDQDYFQNLKEGVHYLTYVNDLSDISERAVYSKEVADNAKDHYEKWIKPGSNFVTNENLLGYMLQKIKEHGE